MSSTRTVVPAPVTSGAPQPDKDGVTSDNVPQQISHAGQNLIELRLPPEAFIASAVQGPRGDAS
jgi:hypothetical protein